MAVNFVGSKLFLHTFGKINCCLPFRCQSTSQSTLVDVKLNDEQGTAAVVMSNAPVNALNQDLIESISVAVEELEKNHCRGIILTSAYPKVFCAGLDLREIYQPNQKKFMQFFSSLQSLWLQLYGSKMASVALINGHSPAGGCLLSLSCDYRVMVQGDFTIGLNESRLGMVAPYWLIDAMVDAIGIRQAEMALQLGTLFNPDEAYKIGLIDSIAPDIKTATSIADKQLQEFINIPSTARYMSKINVRGDRLRKLAQHREADMINFVTRTSTPEVQEQMGQYIENLKKK